AGQAAQDAAANRQAISNQQALANATDSVTAATDRLAAARARPAGTPDLIADLKKSLSDSATGLQQFDALIPQLQGKLLKLGKDPAVSDAFLSRLNDMGVSAVPLLQKLVASSDKTLSGFVDVTGNQ